MSDLILPAGVKSPLDEELDKINLKKTVDYGEGFDRLEDWYYNAIYSFSFYIGKKIPPKFSKGADNKTDKYSSKKGLVAYKECINILKKLTRGEDVKLTDYRRTIDDDGLMATLNIDGLIPWEPYDTLSNWYRDNMLYFINQSFMIIPPKFKVEEDTDKHYPRCAIAGFEKCISELDKYLRG